MHLFGLTGGIASGKSTVAVRLRAHGVAVIDADELAREVLAPGSEGLREVAAAFGAELLGADGALDRAALGRIVFADEAKRMRLNAITHPRITRLTMERAAELAARGDPLACYEAALIVENGVQDAFRPLVVVSALEDLQIARVRLRDGSTEQEARARVRTQKPLADKVKVADFVIETTGTLQELHAKVDRVLAQICERVGVDASRYGLH